MRQIYFAERFLPARRNRSLERISLKREGFKLLFLAGSLNSTKQADREPIEAYICEYLLIQQHHPKSHHLIKRPASAAGAQRGVPRRVIVRQCWRMPRDLEFDGRGKKFQGCNAERHSDVPARSPRPSFCFLSRGRKRYFARTIQLAVARAAGPGLSSGRPLTCNGHRLAGP